MTESMNVIHLVPALFGASGGVFGGGERYALELARHMAAAVPTTLVSFGAREREEEMGPLRVRVIGNPWYVRGQPNNPVAFSMVPALIKADIVHCYQRHLASTSLAALTCRVTGRRVFVTDLGGGGWDISGYIPTDRWYHGHLHVSEYSRQVHGHADVARAHVISGGVDSRKFSPDDSMRRSGTVLFVGRLVAHKGIDVLLKAVPRDVPIEIIGEPGDPRFLDDLRALAGGKAVTFRHGCDDAALVDAYRRALCLVLPSVYTDMYGRETRVPELLGQTLLEAMACGTPAICSDVASMPEVVEDGVTGFVVPARDEAALADRIRRLHNDPALARRMGQAGRQRVLERFTWQAVVDRCLEIYRS